MAALYWIKGRGAYKQFVSNRVKKINAKEYITWRHVSTKENPANRDGKPWMHNGEPTQVHNGEPNPNFGETDRSGYQPLINGQLVSLLSQAESLKRKQRLLLKSYLPPQCVLRVS